MITADLPRVARVRDLARSGGARRIREDSRIGLREMAEVIGVSATTLLRWEAGLVMPRAEHALLWADALAELEGMTS
jgi:transcriptional regulator with XRE-family HTH domain